MTKQELFEVLRDISLYTFPIYTFEGKKYVPLENAIFLRDEAKKVVDKTKVRIYTSKKDKK